ncbi:MAG: neutral zinc metallopeptidase [Kofleriaceae bacterium]
MKWTRGQGPSGDVIDRRGARVGGTAAKVGGGGAILAIIVALIAQAAGVELPFLGGSSGTTGAGSPLGDGVGGNEPAAPIDPAADPDRELVAFIDFTMKDIQDTFTSLLPSYRRAKLVIFTSAIDTGCGRSSSAIGPFYCPPDERAYIDLSFYRELRERFGAPGDFAQAYVLAHEVGHHLQNLLGADERVRRETARDRRRENELSVRLELQADCYAGVWGHHAGRRELLEGGDVDEAITAAQAIGDDRLQKQAGARVNPETWTHGSSAQRAKWFRVGMQAGTLEACDTFAPATP